jgi:hypothetical protein
VHVKVWRQAVNRYLLPDLPGQWTAAGWAVHQRPAGWLTRTVLASIHWSTLRANAVVQFLAVPHGFWVANCSLELGQWPVPSTVEEAEPMMRELGRAIADKGVPYFDAEATLDARLAYLRRRVADLDAHLGDGGWQDVNVDEELTYVNLLLGDLAEAARAAEWSRRIVASKLDTGEWATKANERVQRVAAAAARDAAEAVGLLRDHAAWTRNTLKIPEN